MIALQLLILIVKNYTLHYTELLYNTTLHLNNKGNIQYERNYNFNNINNFNNGSCGFYVEYRIDIKGFKCVN